MLLDAALLTTPNATTSPSTHLATVSLLKFCFSAKVSVEGDVGSIWFDFMHGLCVVCQQVCVSLFKSICCVMCVFGYVTTYHMMFTICCDIK